MRLFQKAGVLKSASHFSTHSMKLRFADNVISYDSAAELSHTYREAIAITFRFATFFCESYEYKRVNAASNEQLFFEFLSRRLRRNCVSYRLVPLSDKASFVDYCASFSTGVHPFDQCSSSLPWSTLQEALLQDET